MDRMGARREGEKGLREWMEGEIGWMEGWKERMERK